jgi:hypothetical protein
MHRDVAHSEFLPMSRCHRPVPVKEKRVMRQEESGRGGPIGPLDWRKILPFEADAASDRLGWASLGVVKLRPNAARGAMLC